MQCPLVLSLRTEAARQSDRLWDGAKTIEHVSRPTHVRLQKEEDERRKKGLPILGEEPVDLTKKQKKAKKGACAAQSMAVNPRSCALSA